MTGNLPDWPGASVVYSRMYRILEHMARTGHVTINRARGRTWCTPSAEMMAATAALDRGDEEACKAFVGEHIAVALAAEKGER